MRNNSSLTLQLLSKGKFYKTKFNYNSDFDLAFQWNFPEIQKVAEEIKKISTSCPSYFNNGFEIVENQYTWDLEKPPLEKKDYNKNDFFHKNKKENNREKNKKIDLEKASLERLKGKSYELWGFYVPAHINLKNYGIYLNSGCIKK